MSFYACFKYKWLSCKGRQHQMLLSKVSFPWNWNQVTANYLKVLVSSWVMIKYGSGINALLLLPLAAAVCHPKKDRGTFTVSWIIGKSLRWQTRRVIFQSMGSSRMRETRIILDQAGMFTVHKMCENRIIPEHGIIEVGTGPVGVNINQE